VVWIAGRDEDAVELLIGIGGKKFQVAFVKPGKCSEDELQIHAGHCGRGCANTGAQRIEEGCDVAREVNADSEPAVEFQGAGGNIWPVSDLLAFFKTRARVLGLTSERPCRARSTVPIEMPRA